MKLQLQRQDGPESTSEFLRHITATSLLRAVPSATDICHGKLERPRTVMGWVCGLRKAWK